MPTQLPHRERRFRAGIISCGSTNNYYRAAHHTTTFTFDICWFLPNGRGGTRYARPRAFAAATPHAHAHTGTPPPAVHHPFMVGIVRIALPQHPATVQPAPPRPYTAAFWWAIFANVMPSPAVVDTNRVVPFSV